MPSTCSPLDQQLEKLTDKMEEIITAQSQALDNIEPQTQAANATNAKVIKILVSDCLKLNKQFFSNKCIMVRTSYIQPNDDVCKCIRLNTLH
jgi:hypothetical protein